MAATSRGAPRCPGRCPPPAAPRPRPTLEAEPLRRARRALVGRHQGRLRLRLFQDRAAQRAADGAGPVRKRAADPTALTRSPQPIPAAGASASTLILSPGLKAPRLSSLTSTIQVRPPSRNGESRVTTPVTAVVPRGHAAAPPSASPASRSPARPSSATRRPSHSSRPSGRRNSAQGAPAPQPGKGSRVRAPSAHRMTAPAPRIRASRKGRRSACPPNGHQSRGRELPFADTLTFFSSSTWRTAVLLPVPDDLPPAGPMPAARPAAALAG